MNIFIFFGIAVSVFLLSYLPGRIFIQIFNLNWRLKFVASWGISFLIYYLAGLLPYISNVSYTVEYLSIFIIVALTGVYLLKTNKFKMNIDELKILGIFFAGYLFICCIQGLLPYYSGGSSSWDWFEYYYRSLIFFKKLPTDISIGGTSILPQRLPLYNAGVAFFMSIFNSEFWLFQLVSTLFNLSALLPCFYIADKLTIKSRKHIAVFVFIMSLVFFNLHFVFEVLYTWTKAMTSYYVLIGLSFLFEFKKNRKSSAVYLLMGFLAAGQLVHLVSLPYNFMIVLIIMVYAVKYKRKLHFVFSGLLYILTISSWYVWAFITYGAKLAFFSTPLSMVTASIPISQRLKVIAVQTFYTFVPVRILNKAFLFYNDKSMPICFYDMIHTFFGDSLIMGISITLSAALAIYIIVRLKRTSYKKMIKLSISAEYKILFLVALSGLIHYYNSSIKSMHGFGLFLFTSTLIVIAMGAAVVPKLARELGKKFMYFFLILIVIESSIGLGYKIYGAKYLLDPAINKDIDLKRDLFSLPVEERYRAYPANLINYQYKVDNKTMHLYDRFADLQLFFTLAVIGGGLALLWGLRRSIGEIASNSKS